MKSFLVLASAVLSLSGVYAGTWFDTGIASYTSWPTDDSAKLVEGHGQWTNTASVTLQEPGMRIVVVADARSLVFDPAVHKTPETATLTYSLTTRFTVDNRFSHLDGEAKCGIAAVAPGVICQIGQFRD